MVLFLASNRGRMSCDHVDVKRCSSHGATCWTFMPSHIFITRVTSCSATPGTSCSVGSDSASQQQPYLPGTTSALLFRYGLRKTDDAVLCNCCRKKLIPFQSLGTSLQHPSAPMTKKFLAHLEKELEAFKCFALYNFLKMSKCQLIVHCLHTRSFQSKFCFAALQTCLRQMNRSCVASRDTKPFLMQH